MDQATSVPGRVGPFLGLFSTHVISHWGTAPANTLVKTKKKKQEYDNDPVRGKTRKWHIYCKEQGYGAEIVKRVMPINPEVFKIKKGYETR